MYQSKEKNIGAKYAEVSSKLAYIRRLLRTEAGRKAVSREVRDKWL